MSRCCRSLLVGADIAAAHNGSNKSWGMGVSAKSRHAPRTSIELKSALSCFVKSGVSLKRVSRAIFGLIWAVLILLS